MKKIYISGALTNVSNSKELKKFYEEIGKTCEAYGFEAYVPHLKTDPILNADITPQEVFKVDKNQVINSDLLIAYIGEPSIGVGMEIAYAEEKGIPVILVYNDSKPVSRFPRGIPNKYGEIIFRQYEEAVSKIRNLLIKSDI